MIYLASPYNHHSKKTRVERFKAACRVTARLMEAELDVFSPIAHSHPVSTIGKITATDHDFWMRRDLPMLRLCDCLLVLHMDGTDTSQGIIREMNEAKEHRIPIFHTSEECLSRFINIYRKLLNEKNELEKGVKPNLIRFVSLLEHVARKAEFSWWHAKNTEFGQEEEMLFILDLVDGINPYKRYVEEMKEAETDEYGGITYCTECKQERTFYATEGIPNCCDDMANYAFRILSKVRQHFNHLEEKALEIDSNLQEQFDLY